MRERQNIEKTRRIKQQPIPPAYRPLLDLTVDEALRLCQMLAAEELGLPPNDVSSATPMAHCARREHHHQGNATESLHINPYSKKNADGVWVPTGNKVGRLYCYGHCKAIGSIVDYVRDVGPEGAADRFWTRDRVAEIVANLRAHKPFELGWDAWKAAQGLPRQGISSGHIGHLGINAPGQIQKQDAGRCRLLYRSFFVEGRERADMHEMITRVCAKRSWSPDIVRAAISEGLMALRPADDGDIIMAFAYRGICPCSPGFPVRVIKTRMLNKSQKDAPDSRATYNDPAASNIQLGDYSACGVSFQTAPQMVLLEGEPDAISWRHFRPQDAIICVGNTNYYRHLPDFLDVLNVKGRDVIYVIDRDVVPHGTGRRNSLRIGTECLAVDMEQTRTVMAKLVAAGARVKVWICPDLGPDTPHKDVNDYLKAKGPHADILSEAVVLVRFMSHDRNHPRMIDSAVFRAVSECYRGKHRNMPVSSHGLRC